MLVGVGPTSRKDCLPLAPKTVVARNLAVDKTVTSVLENVHCLDLSNTQSIEVWTCPLFWWERGMGMLPCRTGWKKLTRRETAGSLSQCIQLSSNPIIPLQSQNAEDPVFVQLFSDKPRIWTMTKMSESFSVTV
jgi:hypothetical protein